LAKIVADPGACRVDYHWKVSSNGRVLQDKDHVLSLKDVKNIVVMSREQTLMSPSFAASHPELRAKVDPPVFQLEARLPKDQADSLTFYFYDEDLVNQVARALVHAVELCGGGKSEAFVPPPGCRIGRTEHFSESATKPKR
jgi:hypothetical protein